MKKKITIQNKATKALNIQHIADDPIANTNARVSAIKFIRTNFSTHLGLKDAKRFVDTVSSLEVNCELAYNHSGLPNEELTITIHITKDINIDDLNICDMLRHGDSDEGEFVEYISPSGDYIFTVKSIYGDSPAIRDARYVAECALHYSPCVDKIRKDCDTCKYYVLYSPHEKCGQCCVDTRNNWEAK